MTRSNWEVEDGAEPSLVNNCRQTDRNGGRPFKMKAAKLRLAQASQPVRGEKIKIAASRKLTYSPAKAVKELLND